MSLNAVRPYFRARLNALSYKEWSDGFNFQNIPENIVDKSFHLDANTINNVALGQTDLEVEHQVITRVWYKGFKTPKEALDRAMERIEDIIVEVLNPSNRLTGATGLRNVEFVSVALSPIAESNDNTIEAALTWNTKVFICLND